jgi:hypothetical protein
MLAEKPVAVGARPGEREADGERKERLDGRGEIAGNAVANIQPPGAFPKSSQSRRGAAIGCLRKG